MSEVAPPQRRWVAPWALIAALAVLFCMMAVLAGTIGTLPWDEATTRFVQRAQGGLPKAAMYLGNAMGSTAWAIGFSLLVLIGLVALRWSRDIWFLLVVMLLRLLALAIKGIIRSPRPTELQATLRETFTGYGFPSGHTLTATLVYGCLAFLAVRHVEGRQVVPVVGAIWILGVSLTAFARIWSGAHWTSDVIGAIVLGVLIVLVAANVSAWIIGHRRKRLLDTGHDIEPSSTLPEA